MKIGGPDVTIATKVGFKFLQGNFHFITMSVDLLAISSFGTLFCFLLTV